LKDREAGHRNQLVEIAFFAGAKAQVRLTAFGGTTKVMPCYKTIEIAVYLQR
jgi:hypothetical protein